MSTEFFTGPLFHRLGDVDVSWIVGIALPGALYYWLTRSRAQHDLRHAQIDRA